MSLTDEDKFEPKVVLLMYNIQYLIHENYECEKIRRKKRNEVFQATHSNQMVKKETMLELQIFPTPALPVTVLFTLLAWIGVTR